ncbi:MAG: hypothetical protein OQK51_14310 [Kangiellaceae bacterium]|nr:hypothetical protein [Kangiellaceae bacterium]
MKESSTNHNISEFLYIKETIEEILPAIRLSILQRDHRELKTLWDTYKESLHILATNGLDSLVFDIEKAIQSENFNLVDDKILRFCNAVDESLVVKDFDDKSKN